MLSRHLKKMHREEFEELVEVKVAKKAKLDTVSSTSSYSQSKLDSFVTYSPTFERCFIKWLVATYQPVLAYEHESFREMCRSLNPKVNHLGRAKVRNLLTKEACTVKLQIKSILKDRNFNLTADSWTSCNNITFVTCTAHFIDSKS